MGILIPLYVNKIYMNVILFLFNLDFYSWITENHQDKPTFTSKVILIIFHN